MIGNTTSISFKPSQQEQILYCSYMLKAADNLETIRRKESMTLDLCSTHNIEILYYCNPCKVPLCADCAIFGEEHKGHDFEHISKIFEQQVELIKTEEKVLKERINSLVGSLSAVEGNIQRITDMKEEKANELAVVVDQMSQRLESEFKNKLLALLSQKGAIADEMDFLKGMEVELDRQLTHPVKNKLIMKTKELVRMLQDISSKPLPKLNKLNMNVELTSEVVPSYVSGVLHLKPFSVLRRTTEVVYSDPITDYGLSWRLKVYPNGTGNAKGNYISVFLEVVTGLDNPSDYQYKIEMINQRNIDVCLRRIDLLEQEGYLVPQNDTVVFKFYARPPSYYRQSQDHQKYIKYLEDTKANSNSLITQFKNRLRKEKEKGEKLKNSESQLHMLGLKMQEERISSDKLAGTNKPNNNNQEEQKEEGLMTMEPVLTEYEENENKDGNKELKSLHEKISAMLEIDNEESDNQESNKSLSGDFGEDLKYQDLFGKEDWILGGIRILRKREDNFGGKGDEKQEKSLKDKELKTLGEDVGNDEESEKIEELKLKGLGDSGSVISREGTSEKVQKSDGTLNPIDVEAIFDSQNGEEKTEKDVKQKEKQPSPKKVNRDPVLLQLPEAVSKKLNKLGPRGLRLTEPGQKKKCDTTMQKDGMSLKRHQESPRMETDKENIPYLNKTTNATSEIVEEK